MIGKAILICLLFAIVYGQDHHHEHHEEHYPPPHYSFSYAVHDEHTGDIKSHHEERKGDHTKGVYSLVEPDGNKRTVEYTVEGKSGFNAAVHREHSKHPIPQPKHHAPAPIVHHQPVYHHHDGHHYY